MIQSETLLLLARAAALALGARGFAGFLGRRIVQSPNTFPTLLAPKLRVRLRFSSKFPANFPVHFVSVGPHPALMHYRVVEPADFRLQTASTNWLERGKKYFGFTFDANMPGQPNEWTAAPRGTVVLLHGYRVGMYAMTPWALRLSQEGWRCVLVDLRGHGKSTGKRIYYGLQEAYDLTELLDQLERDGQLVGPVAAIGKCYGAALALRWKTIDPRVGAVVAITPYAELKSLVLNLRDDYFPWMPRALVGFGLRQMSSILDVPSNEFDTTTLLRRKPVPALFVAGGDDEVIPIADVRRLENLAPGSELVIVPNATHEAVTYFFDELVAPVLDWFNRGNRSNTDSEIVIPQAVQPIETKSVGEALLDELGRQG